MVTNTNIDPSKVIAIIQARGGSKGLKNKNIRLLQGHPLVSYSIASGLASKHIGRVILSTDCPEIAEIGKSYGAEIPFLRPPELAQDDTPDYPVFEHALQWLEREENYQPDIIVQLRPTTPFRQNDMLDRAIEILVENPEADCIRGVTVPKQNPFKMWKNGENGQIVPLVDAPFDEPYNCPRQILPAAYWQTGHVDAIRRETITLQKSLTGKNVRPILIDSEYVVDIDTLIDFNFASQKLKKKSLDIALPQAEGCPRIKRTFPDKIELIIFDFDGVFTDNKVYVTQSGEESVVCNRSDGMGIGMLDEINVPMIVLSKESNPVVAARCKKLNVVCHQGIDDKKKYLKRLATERNISLSNALYIGNDINDIECMREVGFSLAVSDAYPSVLQTADLILACTGGNGAVREVCELVLQHLERN